MMNINTLLKSIDREIEQEARETYKPQPKKMLRKKLSKLDNSLVKYGCELGILRDKENYSNVMSSIKPIDKIESHNVKLLEWL